MFVIFFFHQSYLSSQIHGSLLRWIIRLRAVFAFEVSFFLLLLVWQLSPCSSSLLCFIYLSLSPFPLSLTFDSLDSSALPQLLTMADSSIVTLGTARSLLVDSSVYDSRIAETTKDHVFLGMACEDGEGQYAGITIFFCFRFLLFFFHFSLNIQTIIWYPCKRDWRYTYVILSYSEDII